MAVVFDSGFLVHLLHPDANPPLHPETEEPVTQASERIQHLIATLEKADDKVIIPTPVLSEFLVKADTAGAEYLQIMEKQKVFKVASFDKRAAIELAALTREALNDGDKKGGSDEPWQKVKLDRQIVAIAKVEGARTVYSNDRGLRNFAEQAGLKVIHLADLDLPPEDAQQTLPLE